MRSWYIFLLLACFTRHVVGRPQQAEYNNDSDVEETDEEDDSAADSYSADEEDLRPNDQEPAVQEEEAPRSRHLLDLSESRYLQNNSPGDRIARVKTSDTVLDNRGERNRDLQEEVNFNEQRKSYPKRRQLNRYNDANDEQQRLNNPDVSKSSHIQTEDENQANKRTIDFETTANEEEGNMIFTRNKEQVSYINKNENNANDAVDSEQPRYIKQYYNTMQADKDMIDDKTHDGAHFKLRDRREVKEAHQPENSNSPNTENKESNDKQDSEDDESAIKRHIRKLSKTELDQLLSSLTEEKREILKKIIDETDSSDNVYINKREITKKAGAVEENNYIENCQSDLSKVQGGSPSPEAKTEVSASQTTETESSKPEGGSDSSESTQKNADLNLAPLSNQNDDAVQKSSDSNLNTFSLNVESKDQADVVSNVQVTSKTENKRETNLEDLEDVDESLEDNNISGQDYSNEQGYFCSQDDSNEDDENQPHEDKHYKREAYSEKQSELSDSMKSLEESFPNSNAYENSGQYSGPLIRVKRKNYDQIVKKRAARLLPDSKVAYFPYKAENDDEDNDESNEFDDEGFYDRTSNFANSNNKAIEEETAEKSENSIQAKNGNVDNSKSSNENIESDTRSLGSDTDSVLSGVEGVDDNLMYNTGTRNRRTAENPSDAAQTAESSTVMQDEVKSPSENFINVPHYQENDAFGPLSRNYDGDLSRYKRIRRVKQLHNAQDINSNI